MMQDETVALATPDYDVPSEEEPVIPVEGAENGAPWSGDDAAEEERVATDLVAAFVSDVSQVGLLSREEEADLSRKIARRRRRILRLLRRNRRLVEAALESAGRGMVHPDEDFREREAVLVLEYARRVLAEMPRNRRGRKALRLFVEELEHALAEYRVFRDKMMTANVRLVMTLARRYRHPTLSYLDLVQEGVLGLMRAVEKYDPDRGIKFSTYAVWWIWQQITRAADCQGAVIRTPVHWNQFRRRLGRSGALAELGRDPEAIAESCGLPSDRVQAMAQSFQCLSLTAPLGDDDDRTLGDTLACTDEQGPEEAVLETDLGERLALAVNELPPREAEILRRRFGLQGSNIYTLEEIGEQFGVSRERIRQLEARALKRMRAICDEYGISEVLS